ncbi:N-acyl-D-amino-acid deacylase [Nakamurella sp. UYEF19]|uniref:N-acyl-D-amino-acid deacylase family protein n=1 Tax=Nakamurella sp. UYEF19 TaxID=1756392 RepID=UPI003390A79A
MSRTVLRGGTVVDGSGRAVRKADVAVDGPLVTAVGEIPVHEDDVVLDCSGRLVMPGFIDAHSHAEARVFDPEIGFALLSQGITTVIGGQDGVGFAPGDGRYASEYFAALNGAHPTYSGGGVASLLETYAGRVAVNVGYLVPHGTVRHEVMGDDDRPPTTGELARMTGLLRLGLTEGALGLSTGLDYAPGYFADTDELIALNRPVAQVGAIYVSHMRGGYEENTPVGIDEVVRIAVATGVSAHVSHLHGPAALITHCLSQAAAAGADLSFDAYPYRRGCTLLAMPMVPPALLRLGAHAAAEQLTDPVRRAEIIRDHLPQMASRPGFGPGWAQGITLAGVAAPEYRWAEGLTLAGAAERAGTDPGEFGLRIIGASRLAVSAVLKVPDQRPVDELAEIFTHPVHVGSTDGIYLGGHPHPRGWGTFARYLALYTRQRGDYSWEQAARHLSGRTAERHGLGDRGAVAPGRAADLIVVDPATVADRADYDHPRQPAVGIDEVLVNGIVVLCAGRPTGDLPGKGLRRSAKVVRSASDVVAMP